MSTVGPLQRLTSHSRDNKDASGRHIHFGGCQYDGLRIKDGSFLELIFGVGRSKATREGISLLVLGDWEICEDQL